MSQAALDIMKKHRRAQIEKSPSSEFFYLNDIPHSFRGIFDKYHMEDSRDSGNANQKKLMTGIMVAEPPSGLVERQSRMKRESWAPGDKEYTLQFIGQDEEGVPILWLF
jgi:hypothetical protein